MKSFLENKLSIVYILLLVCGTIVNILFCKAILPELFVDIELILVLLCIFIINCLSIKSHNSNSSKFTPPKRKFLTIVIYVIIFILWMISYFLAAFCR